MSETSPVRILLVLEGPTVSGELLAALRSRTHAVDAQVRVVVPNPATAELHLLHPERHDKAAKAEEALREAQPAIEAAVGHAVIGSVSVRHDPMDAVEDVIFNEPVDEIILAVSEHNLARWFHQDLAHRLHHHGLPVTTVPVLGH